MWPLRRTFWNLLLPLKFRFNKPRHIPVPTDDVRKLATIPLVERYPRISISNIPVASSVPDDETERFKLWAVARQAEITRVISQNQPGLPPMDSDTSKELSHAYTAWHRGTLAAPVLPKEYEGPIDLGYLAVAGPYFCFLERADDGGFQWDLRHLDDYEVHEGLRPLGVRVHFSVVAAERRLEATEIECDLGICGPGHPDWELAQKTALCAASNFLSLIRHFNNVHLVAVAQFGVATRNHLGGAHPVRRLLWPHLWAAHYSNELVTELLLMKNGDFEGVFSFTHEGLWKMFSDWYPRYDIRVMDPQVDAERQGVLNAGIDLPALDNRQAHLDVMRAHTRRYLALYYHSDDELRADASVRAWVDDLERRIPGGIRPLLGDPLTVEGLARFIAAFIYLGAVEHEILGTGLWNYQVWTQVQPVRMYANGQREPVDVFQRLVNYNFMLKVRRALLLQDFSYMALDHEGAACFRTFLSELTALQARLDQEEHTYWKMYPNVLDSSVNG
jgi:hypothetical protein